MKRLRCNKCNEVLTLGLNFTPSRLVGSDYVCSPCRAKYWRQRYKANADKERAKVKRYKRTPKGLKIAASGKQKRLKRLKQATPQWLSSEHRVAIRGIYRLANKLSRESGVEWHVDHIVPLAGKLVCGLHVPWNLQVVPASVNLNKGVGV